MNIQEAIQEQIKNNPVALYMKGTTEFPQCGFSKRVVDILQQFKVDFKSFNVLESIELREGIKIFSKWPTIPQLYIKGEFIGGSDIVTELFQNGELEKRLKNLL